MAQMPAIRNYEKYDGLCNSCVYPECQCQKYAKQNYLSQFKQYVTTYES